MYGLLVSIVNLNRLAFAPCSVIWIVLKSLRFAVAVVVLALRWTWTVSVFMITHNPCDLNPMLAGCLTEWVFSGHMKVTSSFWPMAISKCRQSSAGPSWLNMWRFTLNFDNTELYVAVLVIQTVRHVASGGVIVRFFLFLSELLPRKSLYAPMSDTIPFKNMLDSWRYLWVNTIPYWVRLSLC